MESYRLTHWPEPMPAGADLRVRKALAAMSVGWVTRRFLEREMRLSSRRVDTLLDALGAQGALARTDDAPEIGPPPPASVGGAAFVLLSRVSRRIADATRSRQSWWADETPSTDELATPTQPLLCTTVPMPRDTLPAA